MPRLKSGLREYAEYVIERNKVADHMQVVDPRTEEEKINASDLQEIGLQQAKDKNYASGGWGYISVGVKQNVKKCITLERKLWGRGSLM